MTAPLMPKATAVWLVENTTLTFKQIADFCELHELEIQAIADGDVAFNIMGISPIDTNQLTWDEIRRCEASESAVLKANEMELNIIMLAPVLIVALMRSANETFAQNLASPVGVAAVTGALVLFAIAYIWGQKIIAVR